ncbi:MAG TPA: helix-turn-helix transcriptional regulator [Candidatus Kapabacteria bacterium]|jgi:DNA-binding CsgD family transcriptional regulator
MPAKKNSRTKPISAEDILAMYEAVLPLLYGNPKGIDPADKINNCLLKFVWYDFIHYIMEDPNGDHERLGASFVLWERFSSAEKDPKVELLPDHDFATAARQNYERAIELERVNYPDDGDFDYHRIMSQKNPKIVVGFFRVVNKSKAFSKKDLQTFKQLKPHILLLFRTVFTHIYHSQAFQYFDRFAAIGSRLASEYKLSDTEVKLLPDILFGYTNEEIAVRHFISLATVKSHIKHILKKTGTKNRIDFIGRFFTSPEHVQL